LHHSACITRDQEATRRFYEDILGMPLVATWKEVAGGRAYCHTFFGLADGGALAFFQYEEVPDAAMFDAQRQVTPFRHIALECDAETQDGIERRLREAGFGDDAVRMTDHGYCRSLYVKDPNGIQLEFTVDPPEVQRINDVRRSTAHEDLASWLAGDHSPNNELRH